jgi:hypothetical protein
MPGLCPSVLTRQKDALNVGWFQVRGEHGYRCPADRNMHSCGDSCSSNFGSQITTPALRASRRANGLSHFHNSGGGSAAQEYVRMRRDNAQQFSGLTQICNSVDASKAEAQEFATN